MNRSESIVQRITEFVNRTFDGIRGDILLSFLFLILLLPLLANPLGPDSSLFFVSGQKIVYQGAVHYRDIVDVKPPLIYYLNALAILLFGDHQFSIRLLDLLLQLLTCISLLVIVRKSSGNKSWGALAALLYILLYISQGYMNTTQVESFLALFILPAVALLIYRRTPLGFFSIGILCGVVIMLKFTFGVILIGFLLSDLLLFQTSLKERLRNYSCIALGFLIIAVLFPLYLSLTGGWEGFNNMQQFLGSYTGLQFSSLKSFLVAALKKIATNLADEYSLLMLSGSAIGIALGYAGREWLRKEGEVKSGSSRTESLPSPFRIGYEEKSILLLRISSIFFILLLGTIILEGKWLHYHLSRLFAWGGILGAGGILYVIGRIRSLGSDIYGKIVLFPLLFFTVIGLSPLTRYLFHSQGSLAYVTSGPEAFDRFYSHSDLEDWSMEELGTLGSFLKKRLKSGDKLFVSSGVASMIYLRSGYVPDFSVFHSGFIIAPYAPEAWRDSTKSYIVQNHPALIVIHKSDRMENITGTNETSLDIFSRWMEIQDLLNTEYKVVFEDSNFRVYELRGRIQ